MPGSSGEGVREEKASVVRTDSFTRDGEKADANSCGTGSGKASKERCGNVLTEVDGAGLS